VAQDEQRHIGFGVKLLSDLARQDPRCRHAVADMIREVVPYTIAVLVPPGWDRRYTEVFGFTLEEIGAEGARSLETKMRSAGLPLEELPGPPESSPPRSSRSYAPGTASGSCGRGSSARRTARRSATPRR
jgi:hypothetical protein